MSLTKKQNLGKSWMVGPVIYYIPKEVVTVLDDMAENYQTFETFRKSTSSIVNRIGYNRDEDAIPLGASSGDIDDTEVHTMQDGNGNYQTPARETYVIVTVKGSVDIGDRRFKLYEATSVDGTDTELFDSDDISGTWTTLTESCTWFLVKVSATKYIVVKNESGASSRHLTVTSGLSIVPIP